MCFSLYIQLYLDFFACIAHCHNSVTIKSMRVSKDFLTRMKDYKDNLKDELEREKLKIEVEEIWKQGGSFTKYH